MANLSLVSWDSIQVPTFGTRIPEFFRELNRRDPVLSAAGWLHVAGLLVVCAAFPFDVRTVGEVSVWVKPMKFAVSIALYLWTLGWVLHYLDSARMTVLGRTIAAVMSLEFVLIFSQAARGTASHFNSATPYDVAVYRTMGVLIVVNTLLLAAVAIAFFLKRTDLPGPYLWGIRLGLALVLFTGVSGGIMVGIVSHSVGAAGDLRIAHFISLHALQVLPMAGALSQRLHEKRLAKNPTLITVAVALALFVLHSCALLLALAGRSISDLV